jgi:hypothetical protein
MRLPKVSFQIDGMFLFVMLAAVGVGYAYYKKNEIVKTVTEDLNPTHRNNIINQQVQSAFGGDNVEGFFDGYYGTWRTVIGAVSPYHEASQYDKDNALWGLFK